jgi:hypothetical protein
MFNGLVGLKGLNGFNRLIGFNGLIGFKVLNGLNGLKGFRGDTATAPAAASPRFAKGHMGL